MSDQIPHGWPRFEVLSWPLYAEQGARALEAEQTAHAADTEVQALRDRHAAEDRAVEAELHAAVAEERPEDPPVVSSPARRRVEIEQAQRRAGQAHATARAVERAALALAGDDVSDIRKRVYAGESHRRDVTDWRQAVGRDLMKLTLLEETAFGVAHAHMATGGTQVA